MLIIWSSTLCIENLKVIIEETPTNFKTVKILYNRNSRFTELLSAY